VKIDTSNAHALNGNNKSNADIAEAKAKTFFLVPFNNFQRWFAANRIGRVRKLTPLAASDRRCKKFSFFSLCVFRLFPLSRRARKKKK
jgi:hypothetical protein